MVALLSKVRQSETITLITTIITAEGEKKKEEVNLAGGE